MTAWEARPEVCVIVTARSRLQSATTLTAFHETATWATLPEIRLMARMAGLEVTSVKGSYAGGEYDSRSREMLVVLERM